MLLLLLLFVSSVRGRCARSEFQGVHHRPPPSLLQFFRLYADRVPANLFDRLRYIIQVCSGCVRLAYIYSV